MYELEHGDLVGVIKKIYPAFTRDGICHGLAVASMQAIMANDLNVFLTRLYLLGAALEKKSPEEFANAILGIEQKRVELIKGYRKQLLDHLAPENPNISDHAFYRLLEENKDHSAVQNYHVKRNAVDTELTEEQRKLSDVHAFLDNLVFYFRAEKFSEFFEETTVPRSQRITDATLLLGLPDQLLEIIPDEKKELPEEKNFYLNREPLVKKVGSVLGAYNLEELTDYFKQLHPADPGFDPPVTLLIHSGNHVISVSYNSQLRHWQLIDANQLPIKVPSTDKEIAEEVLNALSKNDVAVFSTEIFCHKNEFDKVDAWLSEVKGTEEWKEQHDINKKETRIDSDGHSLLWIAAYEGKIDLVNALLNNKVDVDQATLKGMTPLCIAVQEGHLDVVRVLLENKANVNHVSKTKTPLMIAAINGHMDIINELLSRGAMIDLASPDGFTPLMAAVLDGQLEVVKLLLQHRAKMETITTNGYSALEIAITKKNLAIIQALLDHGADPNTEDKFGVSMLMTECFSGDKEVVRLLIDNKVDVNKKDKKGYAPLYNAIENGHREISEMLIECRDENHQRFIDINKPFIDGLTPLILAAKEGRLGIIHDLLALKDPVVNVNAITDKGVSAFYMAAEKGHADILKALLPHTSPELFDLPIQASSKILLTHALSMSREQEVKNLFQEKGMVEDVIIEGFTPLHAAIFFGHLDAVKTLIAAGCDINKTTQQGISALDFAKVMHQQEIIKELEQAQALQRFNALPIDTSTKAQVLHILDSHALDIEVKTAAMSGVIDDVEDKNDALTVAIHIVETLDNQKKLDSAHLNTIENQVMIANAGKDAAAVANLLTEHPAKETDLKNASSEQGSTLSSIYSSLKAVSANLPFFSPKKTVEIKPAANDATLPITKTKGGR